MPEGASGVPLDVLYALASVVSFTTASFIFRRFTRIAGPDWVNAFKATLATVIFASVFVSDVVRTGALPSFSPGIWLVLLVSGLIGLNLSDRFMLGAYQSIGPARTMMVYRFQPLYLGLLGFVFLGQTLSFSQLSAIGLFIACVIVIADEQRKTLGKWSWVGLSTAAAGMLLDGTGVMLSSWAFRHAESLDANTANLIRGGGALAGFWYLSRRRPYRLLETFASFKTRNRVLALAGCVLGTFVGLTFWLKALQVGEAARVSATAGAAPVLALLIEAGIEKRAPSRHAIFALALCLAGFVLLLRN